MSREESELCIGPVRFVFDHDDPLAIRYDNWPYCSFFVPSGTAGESVSLATLRVKCSVGTLDMPDSEPAFRAGNNWAVWDYGQEIHFCSGFAGREKPRFTCILSASMETCELFVDRSIVDSPLRYPLDQVLTWGLLGRCSGLLFHAACVVRDGKGFVLAGRSGAGKSTLSEFCHQQGWDVLNDDRCIVYPNSQGEWQVAGTPWHGSGRHAENMSVPLQGIYVLEQSHHNVLNAISPRQAPFALLDVTSIAWFLESWSQAALDTLVRICAEVPVERLSFIKSPKAVDYIGKEKLTGSTAKPVQHAYQNTAKGSCMITQESVCA